MRPKIEEEITKQTADGKTEAEITAHLERIIGHYQDTTIPYKLEMLATHYGGKVNELAQAALGIEHYIWYSLDDAKTRPTHAANDGQVFAWDDPPPTGHPGHDCNCRCIAIPLDGMAEPFYPELLIPVVAARRIAAEALKKIGIAIGRVFRDPISKRPKGVPKEWVKVPSNNKEGYKYVKPGTKGSTDVRVQKGNPDSKYPNSRGDYVRWKKDGRWLDKDGNPLPNKQDPKGHIPIDEFDFKKGGFK